MVSDNQCIRAHRGGSLRESGQYGGSRRQLQWRPSSRPRPEHGHDRGGLTLVTTLLNHAAKHDAYAAIEVHRDTATETPEKTYAIADAYLRQTGRLLPITWDHSHFAVVKHLKPFLYAEVLLQRAELIQNARIMHLRPFNGQHAQIPVMNDQGRLTPEFREWLEFATALLRLWLDGPQPHHELWICPEIGPVSIHGYNLSTMPPAWEQAKRCRVEIGRVWRRLLKTLPQE